MKKLPLLLAALALSLAAGAAQKPSWSTVCKEVDYLCNQGLHRVAYNRFRERFNVQGDAPSLAGWARAYRVWAFAYGTHLDRQAPPLNEDQVIVRAIEGIGSPWTKEELFLLRQRYSLADVENPPPMPSHYPPAARMWVTVKGSDGSTRRQLIHIMSVDIEKEREMIRHQVLTQMHRIAPDDPVVRFLTAIHQEPSPEAYSRAVKAFGEAKEDLGAPGAWWLWKTASKLNLTQQADKWKGTFAQYQSRLPRFGQQLLEKLYSFTPPRKNPSEIR